MSFNNEKRIFLEKVDKSKKGFIDQKIISLVNFINSKQEYYTTSSCSGRVVLWQGDKKNGEWLKVSHDLIEESFFDVSKECWLRVEPLILHVCCKDLDAGNELLDLAKKVCKKSSFLSIKNKIIVEIKGSDLIEMPFLKGYYSDRLLDLVNKKMKKNKEKINLLLQQNSQP